MTLRRPRSITSQRLARLAGRVCATGDDTWPLTEVYTGDLLVELPQSTTDDVEKAFWRSRSAQRRWARLPVRRRARVLAKFHRLVLAHQQEIADLIQAESGKNRRMAFEETCDVPMVTSHYLSRGPRLLRPTRHRGPVPFLSHATEYRVPKGVVGIISPWNFPFATAISDAIPALLAGNGVVLKPDNQTALSPLFGVELLERAGLPAGLVQVVCGPGPDVGPAVIEYADYVMFTGSTSTGRLVGEQAGRRLIDCCLELGGKNPMIVLGDADFDEVIPAAVVGVFGNTGQICLHIERIYLPAERYEEFRDRFVAATRLLDVRAAYDFGPEVGSLIGAEHRERVAAHVSDAIEKGATVLTGGACRDDLGPAFFEPTVLDGVTDQMRCAREETFGPVVALYRYRDIDDAIAQANDTDYGLNASVWGGDLTQAQSVAGRLRTGTVNVNDVLATGYAAKGAPSAGRGASGVGSRHGDQGLLKYTDAQTIAVLRKQVMGPQGTMTYEAYAKQTNLSLRLMRRLRIR